MSELFVTNPSRPWTFDATCCPVTADQLDALEWDRAFSEMIALESGAIANPDEARQVGHYWLRAPETAPTMGQAAQIGDTAEAVRSFADAVRSGQEPADDWQPFSDVLMLGIGGSALGPAMLVDALSTGDALTVHFVDNIDPSGVAAALDRIGDRLRHTLVLVASKSGGTVETMSALTLVERTLTEQGLRAGSHLIAITGDRSSLHDRANRHGWRRTFALWDWVGGRTSVTSAIGLLPAELAGIDSHALLAGARDMDDWTRQADWRANPAALLAGLWHVLGQGEGSRDLVVLPYSDRLQLLARYLQQLVMESIGKREDREGNLVEQGLTVYGNKGSTDQHAFVQQLRDGTDDAITLFVQALSHAHDAEVRDGVMAGDLLQGFLLGTRRALTERGRPSVTITVPTIDAYAVGGLIAVFERAVGLYASLIGVNAYHQPGVEAGKRAAEDILGLAAGLLGALGDTPRSAADLASELGADVLEAHYVLERLAATGRATRHGMTDLPPTYSQ